MSPKHPLAGTDFRSDTVTLPTSRMLSEMVAAPLGDDVFGDDPTVAALEREAADLLGMEAALLVPSGTMGNSIAIAVATRPGDEIIAMPDSHVVLYEQGGAARLWGVQIRSVEGPDGCLPADRIPHLVRPDDPHFPRTSAVCLENTHNMQGGRVVPPARIDAVAEAAHSVGLFVHLDGARLLNAAVALDCPVTDLTRSVDSVMLCLSKGLGAPVGSVYASTADRVREARRVRKLLGGGMRQAGLLAACGRVALEEGRATVAADHRRARTLAAGLERIAGVTVSPSPPDSNILMARLENAGPATYTEAAQRLAALDVRVVDVLGEKLRLVVHRGIDDAGVEAAIAAFSRVVSELGGASR